VKRAAVRQRRTLRDGRQLICIVCPSCGIGTGYRQPLPDSARVEHPLRRSRSPTNRRRRRGDGAVGRSRRRDSPRRTAVAGALCREHARLFDGDDDENAREAAELCGHCPAREPCRAWADTLRHNQINGIIAGQHRGWVSHPSVARKGNQ
jgi:hypothetical protein